MYLYRMAHNADADRPDVTRELTMQRTSLCAAIVLALATASLAQSANPTVDRSDPDALTRAPKPEPPDDASLTVAEAVELGRDAIDRLIDAESDEPPADAVTDLDRAFAIVKTREPDHPWFHYLSAGVYRYKGQKFDAVSALERFVNTREGKNEWKAYRILGDLVIDSDFPRLARSHYNNAAELKPNEPSVLHGISRCAAAVGDYTEALDFARQAVSADGREAVPLLNHLARVARTQREWSTATRALTDALERVQIAVKANPGEIGPLRRLEAQYQRVIDAEAARLAEERDPLALERGYLRLAGYTRQRGDVITQITKHNVVRVLDQAANRLGEGTPVSILEEAVTALTDAEREDDAAAVCRRILSVDPDNTRATEWLSQRGLLESDSDADAVAPPGSE